MELFSVLRKIGDSKICQRFLDFKIMFIIFQQIVGNRQIHIALHNGTLRNEVNYCNRVLTLRR